MSDQEGNLFDHPDLLMMCRKGEELAVPRPDEIIPLPDESEFFLLPGRRAMGLDPQTGQPEVLEENAVAAFVCPAHTLTGVAAYHTDEGAPVLPLFAYGAIGYAQGKIWVAAKKVDQDRRQVFSNVDPARISKGANAWMKRFPENRLVRHLSVCALTYGCPAAKNMALGRFEAPLPTARACNSRCLGCISKQPEDSGFSAPQDRITFTPTPEEIFQVMERHAQRAKKPIFSFGQGCEGEPLTEAETIAKAVAMYRQSGGQGTVNINTNASLPDTMDPLARAGLTSIRVSLNSVREEVYNAYYRPVSYKFQDVVQTIVNAKKHGLFVSLNYLFFPGINDTENEVAALVDLIKSTKLDFIQLRNLNLDPELYLEHMRGFDHGPAMGFNNFRKRIRKSCDWVEFGYFNPFVE